MRRGDLPCQEFVATNVIGEYVFLGDLDDSLLRMVSDSKARKEKELLRRSGKRRSLNSAVASLSVTLKA
jgi:hypothetical protein